MPRNRKFSQRGPKPERQRARPEIRNPARSDRAEPGRERAFLGWHACLSLLTHRPDAVLRLFTRDLRSPELKPHLERLARARKPFREVSDEELERIAKSPQHQGIVVVATAPRELSVKEWLGNSKPKERVLTLYLDGVGNPHNLGAILRSAAHFGVSAIIGDETMPLISPAAARIAEGAAEIVPLVRLLRVREDLASLRSAGFRLVATNARPGLRPYHALQFPKRCILVLGSEERGLSPELRRLADHEVVIPGTGAVESLNVSVAAAVLLAEFARQAAAEPQSS